MNLNNLKLDGKTIAIGLLVIVGIFIIGSQLLGGNNNNTNTSTPLSDDAVQNSDIQIGQVVTSSGIDAAGCPVDTTTTFSRSDSVFVVATESNVPAGTDIFARLSRENQPVEDSVLLTADQDYVDTCIYLEFMATSGAEVLDTGSYTAQMVINGNPGPSVSFQVR